MESSKQDGSDSRPCSATRLRRPHYPTVHPRLGFQFGDLCSNDAGGRPSYWVDFKRRVVRSRPLTERSQLLESFADQAVIAIENMQLLKPTQRTANFGVAGSADGNLGSVEGHLKLARRA